MIVFFSNYRLLVALVFFSFSLFLSTESVLAVDTPFFENFDGGLSGWTQSMCQINGGQRCLIYQSTSSEGGPPPSKPYWGGVVVHDYVPGCAGAIEVRYRKSFNVATSGNYNVSAWIGTKLCDVCGIHAKLFLDGNLIFDQVGQTGYASFNPAKSNFPAWKRVYLSSGTHTIDIGASSSFACHGWFASWWDNIIVSNNPVTGGTCDNDGICEAGEDSTACPSDCKATDFTIALDPTVGLANKGDVKDVNVTATLISGNALPVGFSTTNLPTGVIASFSPASCTPPCYSKATITTTSSTPTGSTLLTIGGTAATVSKTANYNLTVLPSSGIATCGNSVCESPETQFSCASDCFTTANMPSPVSPGQIVTIIIEFRDFRYLANGKVSLDLRFDSISGVAWNAANGCNIGGVKLGPTSGGGAIAWPSGTTSENGHFKITALCTIPSSISSGAHTLFATPTIS